MQKQLRLLSTFHPATPNSIIFLFKRKWIDFFLYFQIYHPKSRENNTCSGHMPLASKVASLHDSWSSFEQTESNPGLDCQTCWQTALTQYGLPHGCQRDLASFKKKNSSANLCSEGFEGLTESIKTGKRICFNICRIKNICFYFFHQRAHFSQMRKDIQPSIRKMNCNKENLKGFVSRQITFKNNI